MRIGGSGSTRVEEGSTYYKEDEASVVVLILLLFISTVDFLVSLINGLLLTTLVYRFPFLRAMLGSFV